MDSQIKVCPHCQTINEPNYAYCKRCGAALPVSSAAQDTAWQGAAYGYGSQSTYGPQPGYRPQGGYGYGPTTIDGIPVNQVDAFIGNKQSIKEKIHKMGLTGSKISWNWPVFLTSFWGGPLLTPCWFFYRKMNKIAVLLLAVGLVFVLLSAFIAAPVITATFEMVEELISLEGGGMLVPESSYYGFEQLYESELQHIVLNYAQELSGWLALSSLLSMLQLAYTIVISLLANYLYKRHIIKSITGMAASGNLSWEGIVAKGGTSVVGWMILGAAVLLLSVVAGIALGYYTANEIFSYFPYFQ